MAVMIPEIPNPFQTGSLEDVMFEALRKLPDSCMTKWFLCQYTGIINQKFCRKILTNFPKSINFVYDRLKNKETVLR